MRYLLYILFLLLVISCSHRNEETILSLKTKVIRSFDSTYENDIKGKFYYMNLTLTNISDKPATFWIMNCTWQDNFIFNYPSLHFFGGSCTRNFPIKETILPKDSLIFHCLTVRNDDSPIIIESRIGFLYIDTISCKNEHDFFPYYLWDRSKQNKIFWSDIIKFDEN